jgi:hypothetical protein
MRVLAYLGLLALRLAPVVVALGITSCQKYVPSACQLLKSSKNIPVNTGFIMLIEIVAQDQAWKMTIFI